MIDINTATTGELDAKIVDQDRIAELAALTPVEYDRQRVDAAKALWASAQAGDVLVLPVHNPSARDQVIAWLDALAASM